MSAAADVIAALTVVQDALAMVEDSCRRATAEAEAALRLAQDVGSWNTVQAFAELLEGLEGLDERCRAQAGALGPLLARVPHDGGSSVGAPPHAGAGPGRGVVRYPDKTSARTGLPDAAGIAGNRFFRDATSKSTRFQTEALPGGGHRLSFWSPANNPGYGKMYVQDIDPDGGVVREYKDTFGPDGLIERKWVRRSGQDG